MSLVKWKQIDPNLQSYGNLTGSLSITGSLFVNDIDVFESSIFTKTPSGDYSTTNNIEITGSFKLNFDGIEDYFKVEVNGSETLRINNEGIVIFKPFESPPTPVSGGIYYGKDNKFYLGF